MKALIIITFMLQTFNLFAQNIPSQVSQQVSLIRSGRSAEFRALSQAISRSPDAVLRALAPYRTDTLDRVRQWTYEQYHQILLENERPQAMRREVVSLLIEGIADPSHFVRNACVNFLMECNRQDFTPQAQARFSELFNSGAWFSRDLILLAGFIGDASIRATLEDLASSPDPAHRRLLWHVNLALARMGNENAMNWCLMQIERIGINDDVTFDLLPGLVYTRQRSAIDFLISVLNSDEALCTSTNPDMEVPILCWGYVFDIFAIVERQGKY